MIKNIRRNFSYYLTIWNYADIFRYLVKKFKKFQILSVSAPLYAAIVEADIDR